VSLDAVLGISDGALRDRLRGVFDAMLALPATAIAFYHPAVQKRKSWNWLGEFYWRKRDLLDAILDEQSPRDAHRPPDRAAQRHPRDDDSGAR
jgi:hypothetical protein